ncbi:unnamed protein product [Symbiodinium sp. CCMP2592]|nr:unnamed protein product [Symbiodinium sp. CCMP2592]
MSSWDVAMEEEIQLSQETSAQISEADKRRTESTDAGVASEEGGARGCTVPRTWWAGLLKAAGNGCGLPDIQPPARSLNIVSGCTGCSAESFVLQAFGYDFQLHSISERSNAYRDFLLENHGDRLLHVFGDVKSQLEASDARPCLTCAAKNIVCNESEFAGEVHLMVAGSPCDPYSVMRQKRFHEDSVMRHRDYSTMFSSVLRMIAKYLPFITILEQLLGFDQKFDAASPETPYQRPAATADTL